MLAKTEGIVQTRFSQMVNPTRILAVLPRIFTIHDGPVVVDSDLAQLYGVETRVFNKAIKRNAARFPKDFAFQLTRQEFTNLKFQIGTSRSHGGRRKTPVGLYRARRNHGRYNSE